MTRKLVYGNDLQQIMTVERRYIFKYHVVSLHDRKQCNHLHVKVFRITKYSRSPEQNCDNVSYWRHEVSHFQIDEVKI